MATAGKGGGERLEREIGDILYEIDPEILVERPGSAPDTILVYSRRSPMLLFRRLYHWPPAYARRVVPAQVHLPFESSGIRDQLQVLLSTVHVDALRVRVEVRGYRGFEHVVKEVVRGVAREHGILLSRRAAWELIVEGLYPIALIAAVLPVGCDRVELWWERRGSTGPCSPIMR